MVGTREAFKGEGETMTNFDKNRQRLLKGMIGRTIKKVDCDAVNCLTVTFEDGTSILLEAENAGPPLGLLAITPYSDTVKSKVEKTKVVVGLGEDGAFAINIPKGVEVEIRDYDVPDDWDNSDTDEDGDRYQSITLTSES